MADSRSKRVVCRGKVAVLQSPFLTKLRVMKVCRRRLSENWHRKHVGRLPFRRWSGIALVWDVGSFEMGISNDRET